MAMVARTTQGTLAPAAAALDVATLLRLQQLARGVSIGEHLLRYATRLVRATRPQTSSVESVLRHVGWGAGPRAVQALVMAAKARALVHERLAVTREDIGAMLHPVLAHRVLRNFEAEADGVSVAEILDALHGQIKPD